MALPQMNNKDIVVKRDVESFFNKCGQYQLMPCGQSLVLYLC